MPHRTRPMTALLVFTGLNVVLVSTITPVYDFVCFHPYWERRDICKVSLEKVKLQLAEGLLASSCENYRVWTMYWEKIEWGIILRKLEEQLCSQSADVLE
ncbi:hypothetical protein SDJN02_11438 [Cucurbita argyrosperma subsp. argyrosperma]|nr:hypothetical protein SDJN02_11438 [Cucurbita argyrosperma subsp. argyrosperma]